MGAIKDQISEEIKAAMKAKDKTRLNVLRYLKKLFIENDTSKKPIDEMDIVISHAKKVKESIQSYPEGSDARAELDKEVAILAEYLPKQMEESEVRDLINSIASNQEQPNMGSIMKELSGAIKGKFDGKKATELVKAHLNN